LGVLKNLVFENLTSGLDWLKTPPRNDEEVKEKFLLRQRLVRVLVERIIIGKDRKIQITIAIDLLKIINTQSNLKQIQLVGTYTRIQ
jgi:hypothetical protein